MTTHSTYYELIEQTLLKPWLETLPTLVEKSFDYQLYGNLSKWEQACAALPEVQPSEIDLNAATIRIGSAQDCQESALEAIEKNLRILHPWRKGPFDIFGIHIDTEWRSDLKWDRVKGHMSSLEDKVVLDIGCGSGYHCLRIAGAGAKLTMGIDTTMIYVMQFQALQKYIKNETVSVLPLSDEQMPKRLEAFDTIFSMGVLYHQKSPFDHLQRIHSLLRENGEAVIETLIIDGEEGQVLVPEGRYAQMRNVWLLPSCLTLEAWLKRACFKNVQLANVNQTSLQEQRSTSWMTFQSLKDYLDPKDKNLTIEGYPAPKRAIFIVRK